MLPLAATRLRLFSSRSRSSGHRSCSSLAWATFDPFTLSGKSPARLQNLLGGSWVNAEQTSTVVDPLNGETLLTVPETKGKELDAFAKSLNSCPKSGLHNVFKNPERYVMYGEVCRKAAQEMNKPEVARHMRKLIQRFMPKSDVQADYEVKVTRDFFTNFSGDNPRFTAQGFSVSGDRSGQVSHGLRWPFGPVALISPFNFPMEIPFLQLLGALMMGNKVLMKSASATVGVTEQMIRFLISCGMPPADVDLIHCGGRAMGDLLGAAQPRVLQFTGSSGVAHKLVQLLNGKVRVEDAGFDWKILGPDVLEIDYVAWQSDQDAYACAGQKCSAQSIMFVHENWAKSRLYQQLAYLASKRNIGNLTNGPILSHTNDELLSHIEALRKIPGSRVMFGGNILTGHQIPSCYGAIEPTAVFVPLREILKPENFQLCTTEIFGPFQIITEYKHEELPLVLECTERMEAHLTAAIVSNDKQFLNQVYGNTVNGTTYTGIRARTTGAPQNHWFGPAGDPRGAGIGTRESIRLVWTCHREMIEDFGPVPADFPYTQS